MMDAPSLSYLIAHPAALRVTALQPLTLLLLAAAVAFFLWPFGARRPRAWRDATRQRASLLRAAAFGCVVLALASVQLTTPVPRDGLRVVAAVDRSASIDGDGRAWSERYLDALRRALAPGDELAVLTFAGDVTLHRIDPLEPVAGLPDPPLPTATDVGRALDTAMALLPADGPRRILLISDGNETRGDSRRQIPWLRSAGVRIDAAVPPRRDHLDVRVERLVAPAVVAEGHPTAVRVIVHNAGALRAAVLNLYLDGAITESAAVELPPGRTALELPSAFMGRGSHRLRAEVAAADDGLPANNTAETGLTIRGRTRVLLVSARDQSPVARALARKGMSAEIAPPERLADADVLGPYHLVVLEDLSAASLPPRAAEHLEHFVQEGGGLMFVGGADSYGDPAFAATAFERLLPVTLEPHRPRPGSREPLALFLVIDRSNSMGYNSRVGTLRDGEKLRYAKEAALAVLGQLKDEDLVGVIAFDSQPHVIAPLRPCKQNRAVLEDLIPRLVENGGTDFYDALVSAREQLAASRVTRRHVMLLTDGDTNRAAPDEYRTLVKGLAADSISVTTIRIGDNTVNLQLLKNISAQTGGEFHYVEDAQMLPDLMLRETTRALGSGEAGTERYFPEIAGRNQLLQGIVERRLPPLSSYAYAKPKRDADVLLRIVRLDRHDPLLAVWRYGLGRVAAFTASPSLDAQDWLTWPEFAKFWSQLGDWTARAHTDDEYAVDARRVDGIVEIEVRSFGPTADGATLAAHLRVDDETTRDVALVPQQPRRFTARLPDLPPGIYPLTVVKRTAAGAVSQYSGPITVPAADHAEQTEFEHAGPNLSLLTQLTQATGGRLDPLARTVVDREPGTRRVAYPLDRVFLPLAMLLFLGDTALRTLRRR